MSPEPAVSDLFGPPQLVALLVAAQRLLELGLARRHDVRLLARGGVEHGRPNHLAIVALHAAWLVTVALLPPHGPFHPWLLVLYALLQPLRYWCILSLGERWTTRVIVLPQVPLVQRGPYRWLRHPNYLVVALEFPLLPLVFGAFRLALLFGALNLVLLAWRIRIEEGALAPARQPGGGAGLGVSR